MFKINVSTCGVRRSLSVQTAGSIFLFLGLASISTPAKATDYFVSDLTPTAATNGYGTWEKDRSNGGPAAGDGNTLTIGSKTYTKGLGVNAYSEITYKLNGACQTFVSDVGVDDEVGTMGSVLFQVWGNGSKLRETGVLYGTGGAAALSVNVTGVDQLQLIVTEAGDSGAFDHADWGGAKVTCTSAPGTAAPLSGLQNSPPIVINGQQNRVISNVKISNSNGPCITIQGFAKNIRIENSELGPCGDGGIASDNTQGLVVDNVYIHNVGNLGIGIEIAGGSDTVLSNNRIENVSTGVFALDTTRIRVDRNKFLNMTGPMPRGQFVQFDKVFGTGNKVTCNVGENLLGASYPEESINMYRSNGDPADPIQIIGNKIKGGGPSPSGGGIMLGDSGGSYIIARDNVLVDPGQQGISIASGHHISVLNNKVFARQQTFTNVGLTVWNQASTSCYSNTMQGNQVNFRKSNGQLNPYFNPGNCGTVTGFSSNTWNASIDATIYDQPIAACP